MGRFARSQDVTTSTGQTRRSDVIAVPGFSSKHESKSNKTKRRSLRLYEIRAKGMRYFWTVLISIIGISAGWMMGQAWINPSQIPTQVAAVTPSVYAESSVESKQSSEESAIPSAPSDQDANAVEQGSQPNQASDYQERRPNRYHRAVARAPRARAQEGPVSMVLKPFKAINPLKLRKLRPW